MKRLTALLILCMLLGLDAYAGPPTIINSGAAGILTDNNCDQAKYYPIGTLCQDTDDKKLYKGIGSGVEEIAAASLTAASTAEVAAGTEEGKYVNPKELKTVTDAKATKGTLTNGKWCTTNGTTISCTEDAPTATPSGKVCKTITNPSDADNLLFDIAATRTITKVSGICIGGTSAVVILQDAGADGSGTTGIHDALTVDTDGAASAALTYAIHDGDKIKLDIGTVTGVVTQLMVCYE